MHIEAVKTHPITHGEKLDEILARYVPPLPERAIVAITSKMISICQGRLVPKDSIPDKFDLIRKEADACLEEGDSQHNIHLTIKNNILIPTAGIDESNGDGLYILYPENIQQTAMEIWQQLRKRHQVEHLGVLVTDSHTTPMRRGVTGIALGWCGFEPLYSYVGKPDIFGKPLRITQVNNLDALAAAAVFVMGEGAERTPIAIIKNAPKIHFLSRPPTPEEEQAIHISPEDDIYAPLLKNMKWIWNDKMKKTGF